MKENKPLIYINTAYLITLLTAKTVFKATPQSIKEYVKRGKLPQPVATVKGANIYTLHEVEKAIQSNFKPLNGYEPSKRMAKREELDAKIIRYSHKPYLKKYHHIQKTFSEYRAMIIKPLNISEVIFDALMIRLLIRTDCGEVLPHPEQVTKILHRLKDSQTAIRQSQIKVKKFHETA